MRQECGMIKCPNKYLRSGDCCLNKEDYNLCQKNISQTNQCEKHSKEKLFCKECMENAIMKALDKFTKELKQDKAGDE
ncbi:unnamed protein product [marine sediment metagenome]|uniref:Uncharacterized protein n=1 Tax=marine sediment metagenome TaxID=412755 RepID=X0TU31_9ZZZZ